MYFCIANYATLMYFMVKSDKKNKMNIISDKSSINKLPYAAAWIYGIVFTVIVCFLFPMKNGYYLRWIDYMNFFDSSVFEFNHLLNYPGGLLQYLGSYFTQFLFYPWLGTAVFLLMWAAIVVLCISAFQLKDYAIGIVFVIPACLMNGVLSLDENLLVLYNKGVAYSPTLGFLFALLCFWIVSRTDFMGSILLPLLYPFMGYYALLSWLLCSISSRITRRTMWIHITGIVLVVTVPLMYYMFWHGTWSDHEVLYLKGLPDFILAKEDITLWLPYIIIAVLLIVIGIESQFRYLPKKIGDIAFPVIFIGVLGWGYSLSSKPESLRAMIMMQQSMDENDWERVVRLASNIREKPTPDVLTIARLASQKTGKGVRILDAKQDPPRNHPRLKSSIISTALISVPVSYYIGRPNLAYRWAMEHSIKYGKNVFFLKYLVRSSLLSGDYKLAQKYNTMLGNTQFHKAWANRYQKFIDNPELMASEEEFKLIPPDMSEDVFF